MKALKFPLLIATILLLSACDLASASRTSVPTPTSVPTFRYVATQDPARAIETPTSIYEETYQAEQPASDGLSNDNYYKNVDGEQVHAPAYSDTVPSGASARCKDGTYSFSKNRRGTCSGHGGVAEWL